MRRFIEELWLRSIRIYTYNTPISKGKYRLFQTALGLCSLPHEAIPARTRDGRRFSVDLTSGMQDHVFFFGEYEKTISRVASRLINSGDICIDVGANFGWYTTLMAMRCGDSGEVHSFEPVPRSFRELEKNVKLAGSPRNVHINEAALGDKEDTITISIAAGEPTGHASMAAKGQDGGLSFQCRMTTLDNYLIENKVGNVDFVKVDIEGAEMMFLKGAARLFEQNVPPVFQMEMALAQAKHFGYLPNDLLKFIGSRGDYEFYRVFENEEILRQITHFDDNDIGANVFCIPAEVSKDAIADMIEN